MIKYLSLLLLVLVLEGCQAKDDNGNIAQSGISTLKVGGCEYVIWTGSNCCAMVHAGNCHNPIHHLYADSTRMTMGYGSVITADTIVAYKKFVYRPK